MILSDTRLSHLERLRDEKRRALEARARDLSRRTDAALKPYAFALEHPALVMGTALAAFTAVKAAIGLGRPAARIARATKGNLLAQAGFALKDVAWKAARPVVTRLVMKGVRDWVIAPLMRRHKNGADTPTTEA